MECTLFFCDTFKLKRQCLVMRLIALNPEFDNLTCEQKLSYILCPATIDVAKCVSKFLGIMLDPGISITFIPDYLSLTAQSLASKQK